MSAQPMPAITWETKIMASEVAGTNERAKRSAMVTRLAMNTGRVSSRRPKYESNARSR